MGQKVINFIEPTFFNSFDMNVKIRVNVSVLKKSLISMFDIHKYTMCIVHV